MKIFLLFSTLLFVNLTGCASLEHRNRELSEVSSGIIGCLPKDIEVTDYEKSNIETWRASCSASHFICNRKRGVKTLNYMTDDVIHCTAEKPAL
jgi:hypothetical protein